MDKSCDNCKIRKICSTRLYFLTATGSSYITDITSDPDGYADTMRNLRKVLASNCQMLSEVTT